MPLDLDLIMDSIDNDEQTGYCISCGAEHSSCEPDMEKGCCEQCGQHTVFGAEQILLLGLAE